jgi:preprotein translocase SecE subunit
VLGDLARDADANDASFTTVVSLGPQQAPAAAGTTAYEIGERSSVETVNRQMVQGGAAIGLIVVGALALLYLCYANPKTVDFLIATEGEMKKVNWSSRREVLGSTWVVIAVSIIIAAVLLGADVIFSSFFTQIGVLER